MKTSVLAIIASAAMAISAPAIAAETIVLTGTPTAKSGFFGNTPAIGLFTDEYEFTIDTSSNISVLISSIGITNATNIDFYSAFLNGQALNISNDGFSLAFNPTPFNFGAGPISLVLSGEQFGEGSYSGVVAVSAIPEPGTWALRIGGFGMVGGAMRARRASARARVALV